MSDKGALRYQTAFNIRERAGRRKQKPVRRPESRSERIRGLLLTGETSTISARTHGARTAIAILTAFSPHTCNLLHDNVLYRYGERTRTVNPLLWLQRPRAAGPAGRRLIPQLEF